MNQNLKKELMEILLPRGYDLQRLQNRDRKFRALEKSPGPGAPGEIQNINPPAPGAPAFKILTPGRGPRGRGMHNIVIISEFYLEKNTQCQINFIRKQI